MGHLFLPVPKTLGVLSLCLRKAQAQLAAAEGTASAQDLAKAAKLLSDIAAVAEEADLSGIAVIDANQAFLQAATEQVPAGPPVTLAAPVASRPDKPEAR